MIKDLLKKAPRKTLIGLGTLLFAIVVAEIVLTTVIPEWRKYFFDILEKKQAGLFVHSLVLFTLMSLSLGAAQGLKNWISGKLSFVLREAGTKISFRSWVESSRTAPHSGQALTGAMSQATSLYLDMAMEIFISASIVVMLIFANLNNPVLLASSLVYTVAASLLAVFFNKPLITSDVDWQKAEGSFRDMVTEVSLGHDPYTFKKRLLHVASTYYRYIKINMYFTLFSRVKGAAANLIPYVLFGTAYFNGSISLGHFMAFAGTFELIVINSTIVLLLYPNLTKARASYKIVKDFYTEVRK